MDKLGEISKIIFDQLLNEQNNIWTKEDSIYKDIRNLQIDKRGSFGERLILRSLIEKYNRRIEYKDGDQGNYDIKIDKKCYEIKTSSLDVNSKFQNENIKKDANYYGIIFVCVAPKQLYIKCVKKENIPFESLHNRLANKTGAGYKWDFKISEVIPVNTTNDIINEFEKIFMN